MIRKAFVLTGVVALALGFSAVAFAGEQTACPVTGKAIDKASSPHVDWQGQRVYFCCNACPAKFKADPEKYFAKLAEAGVELDNVQTSCPVSGEDLGGEMGDPVKVTYKGRTVKLCCAMCKPKFEKEPVAYLNKLPGDQPAS